MEMENYLLLSISGCTEGNVGMTRLYNRGEGQIIDKRMKNQNTRATQGLEIFSMSVLETDLRKFEKDYKLDIWCFPHAGEMKRKKVKDYTLIYFTKLLDQAWSMRYLCVLLCS